MCDAWMGDGLIIYLGAVVVIAANAGGAWTPIGDVTTTMLWINGHISSVRTLQVIRLMLY
jgi:Na+/H+ antiporter NhaD/arsenite permease-like protein